MYLSAGNILYLYISYQNTVMIKHAGSRAYWRVHTGTRAYWRIHTGTRAYWRVHTGTRAYWRIHTSTRAYWRIHTGTRGFTCVRVLTLNLIHVTHKWTEEVRRKTKYDGGEDVVRARGRSDTRVRTGTRAYVS